MPTQTAVEYDPYDVPPSFWQKHAEYVAAAVVFVFTVFLTVVSFPPARVPEAACAFAVPAVFWAYTQPRWKLFIWTMLAAQVVAWTILLWWLHHVTLGGLLLLGPFVGAWVGSWYLAVRWTMPRMLGQRTMVRLLAMLGLAALWVLIEWSRTWFLSGFPWLPLAASQWQRVSMLQIAIFTGASGVSFVLIALNIGFGAYAHRLFREKARGLNKRSQEFFLALFLVLACFSIHVQEAFNRLPFTEPLARIAIVQPDIPQAVKWDSSKTFEVLDVLEKTTLRAAGSRPDVILWPEAVTPFAVKGHADARSWIEQLAARAGAPLMLGSIGIDNPGQPNEEWYNGVFAVDAVSGLQPVSYAKRHLVPFGEYVPLRPLFGWLDKVVDIGDGDFKPGSEAAPIVVTTRDGAISFGPLICYEDIFPKLARESALNGAEVLAVLTNNGWYGRENAQSYQHAAHSVLRAVETRRPVLRCGNAGWSGWIDEFGNVRAELKRMPNGDYYLEPEPDQERPETSEATIFFRGAKTLEITRDKRWIGKNTFYAEHGDWFVVLCLGLVVFGGCLLKVSKPVPVPPKADDEA